MISKHFCDTVSGPEKAGVGGSIPSLATILFKHLRVGHPLEYVPLRSKNLTARRGLSRFCEHNMSRFIRPITSSGAGIEPATLGL